MTQLDPGPFDAPYGLWFLLDLFEEVMGSSLRTGRVEDRRVRLHLASLDGAERSAVGETLDLMLRSTESLRVFMREELDLWLGRTHSASALDAELALRRPHVTAAPSGGDSKEVRQAIGATRQLLSLVEGLLSTRALDEALAHELSTARLARYTTFHLALLIELSDLLIMAAHIARRILAED